MCLNFVGSHKIMGKKAINSTTEVTLTLGGTKELSSLSSTEIVKLDKTVSRGPQLKQPLSDACAMSYDVIFHLSGIILGVSIRQ